MTTSITVNLKLGGALVEYAPAPNVTDQTNKHTLDLETNSTVQAALNQLGVPVEQPVMIILNDAMVARPDYETTLLSDGDTLALMKPITAG